MNNDDVQRLLDIEEIKMLKARYFRYIDTKNWAGYGDLFTDDFEFEPDPKLGSVYGTDGPTGRDALVALLGKSMEGSVSVHRGYTAEIEITGPDTASAIWSSSDYVAYPGDGPPVGFRGYGYYHEDYVRTPAGWRIKRRNITRLRIDPLEGGLPGRRENTPG
jgi:hypothetical protein